MNSRVLTVDDEREILRHGENLRSDKLDFDKFLTEQKISRERYYKLYYKHHDYSRSKDEATDLENINLLLEGESLRQDDNKFVEFLKQHKLTEIDYYRIYGSYSNLCHEFRGRENIGLFKDIFSRAKEILPEDEIYRTYSIFPTQYYKIFYKRFIRRPTLLIKTFRCLVGIIILLLGAFVGVATGSPEKLGLGDYIAKDGNYIIAFNFSSVILIVLGLVSIVNSITRLDANASLNINVKPINAPITLRGAESVLFAAFAAFILFVFWTTGQFDNINLQKKLKEQSTIASKVPALENEIKNFRSIVSGAHTDGDLAILSIKFICDLGDEQKFFGDWVYYSEKDKKDVRYSDTSDKKYLDVALSEKTYHIKSGSDRLINLKTSIRDGVIDTEIFIHGENASILEKCIEVNQVMEPSHSEASLLPSNIQFGTGKQLQ